MLTKTNPYTIVHQNLVMSTPVWIWIISSLVGLLLLILFSYALLRLGFFRRAQQEEMKQLKLEIVSMIVDQDAKESSFENAPSKHTSKTLSLNSTVTPNASETPLEWI